MMVWKRNVRRVTPYTPGEQPKQKGIIKLNTNENPYPPAPGVADVLSSFDTKELSRYPDPDGMPLVERLAKTYGVDPDQVFVGVGSDEVLALAFLAFFNSNVPILLPDITYSFYEVWAELFKIPYDRIPLDEDFRINFNFFRRRCGGIVIANPNAPTGIEEPAEQIEELVSEHPDTVTIIDEAYADFAEEDSLSLIKKYNNVLITRTFSKSRSLAGSRIGFALGSAELIKCLNNVKYSFNSYLMDSLSVQVGVAALRDDAYFEQTIRQIKETRLRSAEKLESLGFTVLKSSTNFLFVSHPKKKAKEIFEELRQKNIVVRYFKTDRIDNYLRITIGTNEQMQTLIDSLEEILG